MEKKVFLKQIKEFIKNFNSNNYDSRQNFIGIRKYMEYNPDDSDVLKFKKEIISCIDKELSNEDFIKYLTSDDKKHYKKQKLYSNRPFKDPSQMLNIASIIDATVGFGKYPNFIEDTINYLKLSGSCCLTTKQIEVIESFLFNNKELFKGIKGDYPTDLYDALKRFENTKYRIEDEHFKKFRKEHELDALIFGNYEIAENIENKYRSKVLGNLGELYFFNNIKDKQNAIFTAKELGDGFGYDMYYQTTKDNNIIENLIEVKTTFDDKENDYISLSENEYKTMLSVDDKTTKYYVARVFFDHMNNSFSYALLKRYQNSLIGDDCNYKYKKKEEGKYIFVKEKNKVLKKIK